MAQICVMASGGKCFSECLGEALDEALRCGLGCIAR